MGLVKITGLTQVKALEEKRILTDHPSISIYDDYRARFKHYALAFASITGLTDPELVQKVATAAGQLGKAEEEPWTREDGDRIIAAVGNPPPPSHLLITRIEGRATLVFRKAAEGSEGVRKVTYVKKSGQPSVAIKKLLRDEGITIPKGMCLSVPVKLGEDDGKLVVVADLSRRTLSPTSETAADHRDLAGKVAGE